MVTPAGPVGRDILDECVEKRFGVFRVLHWVQWSSNNGSIRSR